MLERLNLSQKEEVLPGTINVSEKNNVFVETHSVIQTTQTSDPPVFSNYQGGDRVDNGKCLVTITPSNYQNVTAQPVIKERIVASNLRPLTSQINPPITPLLSQPIRSQPNGPQLNSPIRGQLNPPMRSQVVEPNQLNNQLMNNTLRGQNSQSVILTTTSFTNSSSYVNSKPLLVSSTLSSLAPTLVPKSTCTIPQVPSSTSPVGFPSIQSATSSTSQLLDLDVSWSPFSQGNTSINWPISPAAPDLAPSSLDRPNLQTADRFEALRQLDVSISRRHTQPNLMSATCTSVASNTSMYNQTNSVQQHSSLETKSLNCSPAHNKHQQTIPGNLTTNPFLDLMSPVSQQTKQTSSTGKDERTSMSMHEMLKDWQLSPRALITAPKPEAVSHVATNMLQPSLQQHKSVVNFQQQTNSRITSLDGLHLPLRNVPDPPNASNEKHNSLEGGIFEAFCDYAATKDDELSLKQGDKYLISEVYEDGWCRGKNLRTGETGVCPSNHLRRYSCKQSVENASATEMDASRLEMLKKMRQTLKETHSRNLQQSGDQSGGNNTGKGERYRCIVPFPASSQYELTLQVGDVLSLVRRREDGWSKGIQHRTGKTGLFPQSFVERIG